MAITRLIIVIVLAAGSGLLAGVVGTSAVYSARVAQAEAQIDTDATQIADLLGQVSGFRQQIAGFQAAAASPPACPAPVTPGQQPRVNTHIDRPTNPATNIFGPSIR